MNIEYFPDYFDLVVSFNRNELDVAAYILRISIEEAKEKGMRTPDFGENFYTELSTSVRGKSIVFDFGALEVGMLFLDNYYDTAVNNMIEVTDLGKSIDENFAQFAPYCVEKPVLH